jgi:hypothetical protein
MNSNKRTKTAVPKRAASKAKPAAQRKQQQQNNTNNTSRINGSLKSQSIAASYFQQSGTSKPRFTSLTGGDARIRVKHNEYFDELFGSLGFQVKSFPINPGMTGIFPWLSSIAANYETYKFNSLKFHYKTVKGSTAVGTVGMSVDYDAADAPPTTLMELFQNNGTIDSAVWSPDTCMICAKQNLDKMKQRYIRTKPLLANQDIKTYDVGNLLFATQDEADLSKIGRLWVEYDVELMTPQGRPLQTFAAHITAAPAISVTKLAPFGTAPVYQVGSNSPITVGPLGQSYAWKESGEWVMSIKVTGTGVVTPGINPSGGTVPLDTLLDSTITGGNTAGSFLFKLSSAVNDAQSLDFSGSLTISAMDVWIGEYIYAIV